MRGAFVALAIVFPVLAGCAGKLPEAEHPEAPGSAPMSRKTRSGILSAEDSLALVERVVGEVTESIVRAELLEESSAGADGSSEDGVRSRKGSGAGDPQLGSEGGHLWRAIRMNLQSVWGFRSDHRGVLQFKRSVSAGLRVQEEERIAYVLGRSMGAVETGALGNLRADFGEGVVLGARSPYAPPVTLSKRGGEIHIRPSLSSWCQTRGAAITLRASMMRLSALAWERPSPKTGSRERELWISVSLSGADIWMGAAAGMAMEKKRADRNPGESRRAMLFSFRSNRRDGGLGVASSPDPGTGIETGISGEIALLGGDLFFALGTSAGEPGSRWWLRIFKQPAPESYMGSTNGLSAVSSVLQGGALGCSRSLHGVKASAFIYAGASRSASRENTWRRCAFYLSGRRKRPHNWELSTVLIENRKAAFRAHPLETEAETYGQFESRLRARWMYHPRSVISHRLGLELRFSRGGLERDVLISSGMSLNIRSLEIAWRVTNYALSPCHWGYISRPGVGSFESFSSVYGDGSDVSLRARLHLLDRWEILGYYGKPWERSKRLYLGIRFAW